MSPDNRLNEEESSMEDGTYSRFKSKRVSHHGNQTNPELSQDEN